MVQTTMSSVFCLLVAVSMVSAQQQQGNYRLFLLFGQSNMSGQPSPQSEDRVENPRVKVLAYDNCSNLGRTYNQWYTATPPLSECWGGVGPGDYFAKTLADSFSPQDTIGLIPCSIAGVDIAYFQKDVVSSRRNEFQIPPDNHWDGAYEWMLERCRLAQQRGQIEGIIFHQGESNAGQSDWVGKVRGIVEDLRTDLGIGEVPFIAGELLYAQYGGACAGHNTQVNLIPDSITNAYVVSAEGLEGADQYHFDLPAQRELGRRYAQTMLSALGTSPDTPTVSTPVEYEIATWANFCRGAVSHTFDDNTPGQISTAVPMFDERDLHMTMFVVTSWGPGWNDLQDAFAQGHEIGSHSVSHAQTMSDDESPTSQRSIQENVHGEMCAVIAYPNCNIPFSRTNLEQCYIGGRTCSGQIVNKTPSDFYSISSIITGNAGINSASEFNQKADAAADQNGWCVFLHHGVGNGDHSWSSTSPAALEEHLDYLDQNRDEIWTETFGNVVRYIKERDAATVSEVSADENSITISVTDNLPDAIFNFPLSIRRPLPQGWETAVVKQGEEILESHIATVNGQEYLVFNAVPDRGEVTLSTGATPIGRQDIPKQMRNQTPMSINGSRLIFDKSMFSARQIQVRLFDLKGVTLGNYTIDKYKGASSLPIDNLTQSVIIVRVADGNKIWSRKCLLR